MTVIWTKPSFSVRIEQLDVGSSTAWYKNSVTPLFVFAFALGGGAVLRWYIFLLTGVLEAGSTDVHIAWLLWVRIFKCLAQAHSRDNTGRFRDSDHTIRNRRFQNIALRHRSRVPVRISKAITVKQRSQTFLKLRATSCVPINAEGY